MTVTETQRFDTDRVLGLINYGLLAASIFFVGVPGLVAVILAYAQRPAARPLMRGHYGFQITIFWVGLLLGAVAGISGFWAVLDLMGQAGGGGGYWSPGDLDFDRVRFTARITGMLILSGVALVAMVFWMLISSTIGFIRLISAKESG